jgi:hypothetical protein
MTPDERYWTTWILVTRLFGIASIVVGIATGEGKWLLALPVVGVCLVYFGYKHMKAEEAKDE